MTKIEQITKELDLYRSANGTQWKSKLRELYFSGQNRNEYLQQFRNKYMQHLDKIKYNTTKREIITILTKGQK